MKKSLFYFVACMIFVFYAGKSIGQCTPDPLVTDPEGNGEMVPDTIEVVESVPFNITLTIIAPDTATLLGNTITINHITLHSFQNKPTWLNYACNPSTCEFIGTASRCVALSGTPPSASAGFYPITVLVDVFISSSLCISCSAYPNGYDSGIPMIVWVHPAGWGVAEQAYKEFGVIEAKPNPFNSAVKLGCYTENPQNVSLKVLNMVGQEIYTEKLNSNAGENYFQFNGNNLPDGIYFYSITDAQNRVITKKLIKS